METKLRGNPGEVLHKLGRMLDQRTKHHVGPSSLYDLKPSWLLMGTTELTV